MEPVGIFTIEFLIPKDPRINFVDLDKPPSSLTRRLDITPCISDADCAQQGGSSFSSFRVFPIQSQKRYPKALGKACLYIYIFQVTDNLEYIYIIYMINIYIYRARV